MWRTWCAIGVGTQMGLVTLTVARRHSFEASTWIAVVNHGLLSCIWAYLGYRPPVFLVATSPTILLTLPLPVARIYAFVELAHRMAMERQPVGASIPRWRLVLWLADMIVSCGIAVMVLNMKVGESREKFIPRSAGKDVGSGSECGEPTPLLLGNDANGHYSALHTTESLGQPTEDFVTTEQWKNLGYQGPSPEAVTTIWESITYHWLSDLFKVGCRKHLEPSDCWGVPESMRCERLNDRFHLLR